MNSMEELNTLVAQNTAFRSYAELARAMADGYAPTLRRDRQGQRYQTRGVLGGAYRGPDLARRTLLTHLLDTRLEISGCRVPADNLADEYSDPEGNGQRPTCPRCSKKWDTLRVSSEFVER